MGISKIRLTPKQVVAQWADKVQRLRLNVHNFKEVAGSAAVGVFQASFDMGRFNTAGAPKWKPRKNQRASHPILSETGTLENSIKWKSVAQHGLNQSVRIYTDPSAFHTAKRHKGFCYAAVHNDPSGTHTYGKSGAPSVRRQFIGHSTQLRKDLSVVSYRIFDGFPK